MDLARLPAPPPEEAPTTPYDETEKNPEAAGGFPFDMGEVKGGISLARRFPRSYFDNIEEMRERTRAFTERVVRPRALEIEKKVSADPAYFAWDVMREACKERFFSMLIPKPFEGLGMSSIHMATMAEELAAGCGGLATTIGVHSAGLSCGMLSGDAYILEKYIRPVAQAEKRGEPILWSGAVTEPNAGTDIWEEDFLDKGRVGSHARKVKGGYVLNGKKCFISNGSVSRYTVVAMALDLKNVRESWSAFLVDTQRPGFSIGRVERKLGQKASPTSEQVFEDVFVPKECLIGPEGTAARAVSIYLAGSRGPVGAIGTGLARRSLECLIDWASRKKNGRGRLIDQQALQLKIAELARDIQLARQSYMTAALAMDEFFLELMGSLTVKAAMWLLPGFFCRSALGRFILQSSPVKWFMANKVNNTMHEDRLARTATLATVAKIVGSSAGVKVAGEAIRLMGHDAFDPRWPVDKCYRDAKLTQIYEGTNQANAITQFLSMSRHWNPAAAEGVAP